MKEYDVRMRRLNRLVKKYLDGYYDNVTAVGDIWFFHHNEKNRKNRVNISGLTLTDTFHVKL